MEKQTVKYRIYIDEVGNPDLKSSDNPNHRFLSLTGVIVNLSDIKKIIHPEMEELKRQFFDPDPDDPVIFHRRELVNQRAPFEALRDEQIRKKFDEQLLSFLSKWKYTVITVCIDKKNHKENYKVWRYEPYHYCLAIILERYVYFLRRRSVRGDVMAESRGGKEDKKLKDSFAGLWERGTDYMVPQQIRETLTSKQLKIKPKKNNISGLQLADLLAHPSRNEILKEKGLYESDLAPFAKKIIRILQEKYDRQGTKVFGKKFL